MFGGGNHPYIPADNPDMGRASRRHSFGHPTGEKHQTLAAGVEDRPDRSPKSRMGGLIRATRRSLTDGRVEPGHDDFRVYRPHSGPHTLSASVRTGCFSFALSLSRAASRAAAG